MNLKEQIQKIKEENPKLGYASIAQQIGCSKNTVRYHLDPTQKEAVKNRMRKLRKSQHPLYRKLITFATNNCSTTVKRPKHPLISFEKMLAKIGSNPRCYLTGEPLDILELSGFSLDHIIPVCQGGDSSIENCGLTTRQANASKNGMTPEQFFAFCSKVLMHQGYTVIPPNR